MRSIPSPRTPADHASAAKPGLSRRTLLRDGTTLSLGALVLAACGGGPDTGGTTGAPTDSGTTPMTRTEAVDRALQAAGVQAEPVLTPIIATFEVLTGGDSRITFGLLDEENSPILDGDLQAYVVLEDELVQGPVEPAFYGEGLGNRGVYVFSGDLAQPGIHDLVVVTADGAKAGVGAMQVRAPEDAAVLRPGQEMPSVATPTTDDPQGLEELCTRAENCGMHDVSLDDALAEGRPVVLTIATPKYCQTAVCGPVVDVVLEQKQQLDRDDVAFIHAEVYVDAGNTPTEVIGALGLPSEPWTFLVDSDGVLVDRFDGPVVPQLLGESIEANL